jgi:ECF transporter S component (folate family)
MSTDDGFGQKVSPRKFFSPKGVFSPRNVTYMAMMLAFATILSLPGLTIYLSPTFKAVSFSYLPGVMVAAAFGPWAGAVFGVAVDTLGYFINPAGPYFPGYALSEMATYFIFACFLYRRKFTLRRVAAAYAIRLIVVVFGMNSVWMIPLGGMAASAFFTGARVINNLVQFPFHVALIFFAGSGFEKLWARFYHRKDLPNER